MPETGKRFRTLSLRKKVIIVFIFIDLLIISYGIISFTKIYSIYLENAHNELNSVAERIKFEVESLFDTLDSFTRAQFNEPEISEIISEPLLSKRIDLLDKLNSKKITYSGEHKQAMREAGGQLYSSYFFVDEAHYYIFPFSYFNNDEENARIYKSSLSNPESSPLIYPPSPVNFYLYYVRNVYNLPSSKAAGTMVQCMSLNKMKDVVRGISDDISVYIADSRGKIYVSENWYEMGSSSSLSGFYNEYRNQVFQTAIDGEVCFCKIQPTESNKMYVICYSSKASIINKVITQLLPFAVLELILILGINIVLYIICDKIRKIITVFLQSFDEIKAENYGIRMPEYSDRDVRLLTDGFNEMAEKIQYMFEVVYREESLRKEAELSFLQAQINPHSLFNILATIRLKAKVYGDEAVYQMLLALGELMRAGIVNDRGALITLREELYYVNQYLFLQKIRFDDRLIYEINIEDEGVLNCMIPKLCLESIVENAVMHGIEDKIGIGKVNISVEKKEKDIILTVEDDGIGFDVDNWKNRVKEKGHSNIGLRNVEQRLKLIFGEKYGLSIESKIDAGTCVRICIPGFEEDHPQNCEKD